MMTPQQLKKVKVAALTTARAILKNKWAITSPWPIAQVLVTAYKLGFEEGKKSKEHDT